LVPLHACGDGAVAHSTCFGRAHFFFCLSILFSRFFFFSSVSRFRISLLVAPLGIKLVVFLPQPGPSGSWSGSQNFGPASVLQPVSR
jgi:hypothetical protein